MQLNFIHNQSVASQSGQTLPVIDPSDGQTFDHIQRSNADDIDMAVKSSRACFEGPWSKLNAADRGRLLLALSHKVTEHADELMKLEQH
jgi:aldehyde dehydrogenase (NAD+)